MLNKFGQLKKFTGNLSPDFPLRAPTWPTTVPRVPKKSRLGANYDTEWSRKYPVRLIRALFLDGVTRPLIKTLIPPTIHGEDRIKNIAAPVIFAANHSSHLDTPLLATHIPETFRHKTVIGAGADYFFDRWWKATLWSGLIGAIPIERSKVNRKSGELAESLLSSGWSLIIFPEGGRTPDGFGQVFKGGIAQLAKKANVPVIPIYIKGTYEALGKDSVKFKRGPTQINFGYPLKINQDEDVRQFTKRIQAAVDELAYEIKSDWWSTKLAASKGEVPSLEGPQTKGWRDEWERSRDTAKGYKSRNRWPKTD